MLEMFCIYIYIYRDVSYSMSQKSDAQGLRWGRRRPPLGNSKIEPKMDSGRNKSKLKRTNPNNVNNKQNPKCLWDTAPRIGRFHGRYHF